MDNEYIVMFNLYLCELRLKKGDIYYLEIYHYFDRDKLLLSINPKLQQMAKMTKCSTMITIKNQLRQWIIQLKIASHDITGLKMENLAFTPIGKVMIEVISTDNLICVKKNSLITVKIDHRPFSIKLKNSIYRKHTKWN